MIRELPILFSTPMVQAIQAGTKNQTRRTAGLEKVNENPNDWKFISISLLYKNPLPGFVYNSDFHFNFMNKKGEEIKCKPRYQKDDKIWVKETYTLIPPQSILYRAGYTSANQPKWKSSLFMRKEYARTWLECTGVRCERLLDISKSDAIGEGILERDLAIGTVYKLYAKKETNSWDQCPIVSYTSLWDSINGEGSYLKNPWVFIYDFKRIEKP